jgi:hypothetical protein
MQKAMYLLRHQHSIGTVAIMHQLKRLHHAAAHCHHDELDSLKKDQFLKGFHKAH